MFGRQVGLLIMGVGLLIILAGFLVFVSGFAWFGNLPGDIRIEQETVKIYIPITSMLLISIALSIILYLIRRIF